MTEFTAIALENYGQKAWIHSTDYSFSAEDTVIPLVVAELRKAGSSMPTGFVEQEAGYQLVAITSLQPEQNLYVEPGGHWQGPYVPTALRAHPFRLLSPPGSAEKAVLCINEACELVVEKGAEGGNDFFDDENQPTQGIKGVLNFLFERENNLVVTQRAVNALGEAGLITPWALNLVQGEEVVPVKGLFQVDEAALNKLDDADFLKLREAGGLALAYAQLGSMHQLTLLESLGHLRGLFLEQETAKSEVTNLTGFSLAEDEGSLIFD